MLAYFLKIPKHPAGFTLAELLISLAILGVIATFTIPKILSNQQDASNTARTKEIFATVSAAYQAYLQNNQVSSGTTVGDLTPFMNYVGLEPDGTVVDWPQNQTYTCTPGVKCLKFHSGARLIYFIANSFGGTTNLNALWFTIEPDGTQNNSGAIWGFIYTNGRISTHKSISTGTVSSDMIRNPCPTCDPPWFNW